MSVPLKQRLLDKLENFPLLRQMVAELWFRIVFTLLVLGGVGMILFLPKWWKVSPEGFEPEVEISGLDIVQAWSLKRSAIKAQAENREDDAAYAWSAAVANTPTNIELIRDCLRFYASIDIPKAKFMGTSLQHSFWLLRLNNTNKFDVEITTQVFEKFRLHELVMAYLRPYLSELTPVQEATYLKALFNTGQTEAFWNRMKTAEKALKADPELSLFRAAYQAGWGSPEEAPIGRETIEKAMKDPKQRITAHHVQLMVCWQTFNTNVYAQTLEQLIEMRADTTLENVNYWRLLALAGHKEVGRKLAMDYPHQPSLAREALEMAEAMIQLDLTDHALKMLKRYAPQFAYNADLWATFADLLLKSKRWDEIRELALQIRNQDGARTMLASYSYYLQGRAELGDGRKDQAKELFERAASYNIDNASIGMRTASGLLQLGYAEPARDMLVKLKEDLKNNVTYWKTLFDAAYQNKQQALLLDAALKAYNLDKNDVSCKNNYAAALLINRLQPNDAIQLTMELMSRYPDSTAVKINHSIALIRNKRLPDAHILLDTLATTKLTDLEKTAFNLALFELAVLEKKHEAAWLAFDQIEKRHLFPEQLLWLDSLKQGLPPKPAANAARSTQ